MTVEAYLSVKILSWRKLIFSSKKAALVSLLIVLTFLASYISKSILVYSKLFKLTKMVTCE